MSQRFAAALGQWECVALDSSLLIYHLEDTAPYSTLTETLFASLAQGKLKAILSTLSLTELLTKPFAEEQWDSIDVFEQFLASLPNTVLVPPDYPIARDAARLRGRYGIRTPDALLLATARQQGANAFVTNDKRLKKIRHEGIAISVLADYTAPA